MRELEGKVALVTGASKPTGIGYAIALALAREGAALTKIAIFFLTALILCDKNG